MKKRKAILSGLLAGIMVLGMAACGKAPETVPEKVEEPAPIVGEAEPAPAVEADAPAPVVLNLKGGSLGYPNPFRHSGKGQGTIKMWLLYDALMEKDEKGLVPWLATDYTLSDDSLTYTFTLRQGVKWSDGTDLTVDDVLFSYDYYRSNECVVSNLVVDGEYMITDSCDNGDGTFSLTVNSVYATNLEYLTRVPILPKHIWEGIEDPFNYAGEGDCIGSGPFVLTSCDEEKGEYQFVANPLFWGSNPVGQINYIAVSDDVLAFDHGEIDYLNAPWDLYEKYENLEGCKAVSNQPFLGYNMVFNLRDCAPLQDMTVRQAIAYAVNRQQIVDLVFNGHATVASAGYLPQGHSMRNEAIRTYDYEPEKALELLGGKELELTMKAGDSQELLDICELIKLDLARVGITLNVVSCDGATLKDAYSKGEYDIYMSYGGGWGADADRLHSMYAGWDPETKEAVYSNCVLGYYNEELYQLAQEQQRCVDLEARTALIGRMQEIIAEEVPTLPVLNCYDMLVYRPEKYDGWRFIYDYNYSDGVKLSFADAE